MRIGRLLLGAGMFLVGGYWMGKTASLVLDGVVSQNLFGGLILLQLVGAGVFISGIFSSPSYKYYPKLQRGFR